MYYQKEKEIEGKKLSIHLHNQYKKYMSSEFVDQKKKKNQQSQKRKSRKKARSDVYWTGPNDEVSENMNPAGLDFQYLEIKRWSFQAFTKPRLKKKFLLA